MSSFHSEGKKIYYEEIGNGKPLLLLHGNTACGKMFAPILPMLSEKHHVIVPDFLGCGQSERCENGLRTFGMNGQGRQLPFANIKDLKKWM